MGLEAIPREILVAIAVIATLYAVVTAARRFVARTRLRLRFERAAHGELAAAAILEDHGYTIEGAQVTTTYPIEVDGAAVEILLRADYVVTRGGDRFVAEVKTGQLAPRVQTPATRRQLLEYHVAFGVSGVLLVDAESRSVHRIAFPLSAAPTSSRESPVFLWMLVVTVIALVVMIVRR